MHNLRININLMQSIINRKPDRDRGDIEDRRDKE